jgi:stage V sporulation protein R
MDDFINPDEYIEAQKKKLETQKAERKRSPRAPERDVLKFLLDHAPLERWERDVLEVMRDEAYYFVPADADEDHERGLGQLLALPAHDREGLDASEIIDYAERNAGSWPRRPGASTPTSSASSSTAHRGALERASSARSGTSATTRRAPPLGHALGLGRKKIFEVRALQRRHLHRRVPHARVRHRAEALHLRLLRPQRPLRDREPKSSRR